MKDRVLRVRNPIFEKIGFLNNIQDGYKNGISRDVQINIFALRPARF